MFMRYKVTVNTSHYPKDVPFEVPEGWVWTTIAEISSSINYGVSESAKVTGKYRLLRITDIQDGKVSWESVPFTDYPEDKAKAFELSDGDILFARTGATVGKSYLVEAAPNNAIFASYLIRVQYSHSVIPQYIKFFFESGYYWEQISSNSVGIGQPNVNGTSLGKLRIPLPPAAEQKRISKEAHRWMGVIDRLEFEAQHLSEDIGAFKSKILDLAIHGKLVSQDSSDEPAINLLRRINPGFQPSHNLHYEGDFPNGWVSASLGEVSNYGHCISVPVEKIGNDDWVLELEDIEKDTGRILQRLSKKDRKISGIRHQFKKGQILYSKLRTYLNKVLIADEDGFCTTEIIPITPINGVNALFLIIVLRSQYFLDYTQNCCYGVKMPRLGTNDAKKAVIPLPPFEEQGRIVAAVKGLFLTITQIGHVIENQE